MSHGVGHRRGSDPKLLWLWCMPAAIIAPIRPLTWEPPYAASAALKRQKDQKEKKKKERKSSVETSLFKKHLGTWSVTTASCFSQALRWNRCVK